jgi:hypothetical protein
MAHSIKVQQKICIYCKRIISFDGSYKKYNAESAKFASMDMKSTICPDCSFEKYPKFYGIDQSPNRIGLKKKKSVSLALSSLLELIFNFLARYHRLQPYNKH